jgi:predicted enzyme related to lactoylglutathione lyase
VTDLAKSIAWYEQLFTRTVDIDASPSVAEFDVAGCWLQLYVGEVPASGFVLRFGVDDVEAERTRLLDLGVEIGDVNRVEGLVAFCEFSDPDGNRLSLYEVQ